MAKLTTQYANYASHKFIVDCLEGDGAICDSNAKNYNEQSTYNGGKGFRSSFTKYNQKIKDYHNILKVLTGEQRADITESIPVIDFLDNSNTSLLYTYTRKEEDGNITIDPSSIYSAPSSLNKTALQLIEEGDEFFINRAIIGQEPAEHFYNTTGTPTESSIQVSPWLGNDYVEYIYKGIFSSPMYYEGEYLDRFTIRHDIKSLSVENSGDNISSAYLQISKENLISISDYEKNQLESLNITLVDYSDLENALSGDSSSESTYIVNDSLFVNKEEESTSFNYRITLDPQDICIFSPQADSVSRFSKLYIFKYCEDSSQSPLDSLTWGPYKIHKKDEQGNTTEEYETIENCILNLSNIIKGEVYYLRDYPEGAEGLDSTSENKTSPISIPDSLASDSDIVCIQAISSTSENNSEKWRNKGDSYKKYLFPISNYNSSRAFTSVTPDSEIPSYFKRTGIYEVISKIFEIEKVYTAKASGLLDGLYEEPLVRDSNSKVTKWKFIDESNEANQHNVSIDIGTKYFEGHLLGRGSFLRSPLKLTKSDYENLEESPYSGKLSRIFNVLKNSTSSLFNNYKVDDFYNFPIKSIDGLVTIADLEPEWTYSASEAKDLLGISDSKLTSLKSYTYKSTLWHPDKFRSIFEDPSSSTQKLLQYFNSYFNDLREESNGTYALTLDTTKTDGNCVCERKTYQTSHLSISMESMSPSGKKCGKQQYESIPQIYQNSYTNITSTATDSLDKIYSDINKNYRVKYSVKLEDINIENSSETVTSYERDETKDIFDISIKIITPLEAFSTNSTSYVSTQLSSVNSTNIYQSSNTLRDYEEVKVPTGITLVYPEYSKKLPTTMFLISKDDLKLEAHNGGNSSRSMVSLLASENDLKKNSVVSFKVSSVQAYKPSKIKKVTLKTQDQTLTLDYPNGLYTREVIKSIKTIIGFEKVKINSLDYITSSQGQTFTLSSLMRGNYVLNQRSIIRTIVGETNPSRLESTMSQMLSNSENSKSEELNSEDFEIGVNKLKAGRDNDKKVISAAAELQSTKTDSESSTLDAIQALNEAYIKTSGDIEEVIDSRLNSSGLIFHRKIVVPGLSKNREINSSLIGKYVSVPIYSISYEYETLPSDIYDCYIYVLEPLQISLDNVNIYDQDDKKISLVGDKDLNIIPMSYPSSYFGVTPSKDSRNITNYYLKDKSDVSSLKNRLIIPGLPKFNSRKDLLRKFKENSNLRNIDLMPIVNMIYSRDSSSPNPLESSLGSVCFKLLENFRLSDNTTDNPLLMKDFPSLVEGLISMKPIMQKFIKSDFYINLDNSTYKVTEEDLRGLLNRIDTDENYTYYDYDVDINTSEWDITSSYSADNYLPELRKRIESITFSGSKKESTRPSLKKLSQVVNSILKKSSAITYEECKTLDNYLGNDTPAFLNIGQTLTITQGNIKANATGEMYNSLIPLDKAVRDIIWDILFSVKKNYLNSLNINPENEIKDIYKKYYTSNSVEQSSKEKTIYSSLDFENLYESSSLALVNPYLNDNLRNILRVLYFSESFDSSQSILNTDSSYLNFNLWISKYFLDKEKDEVNSLYLQGKIEDSIYQERKSILEKLNSKVKEVIKKEVNTYVESNKIPTKAQIANYLTKYNDNNSEGSNYFYNVISSSSSGNEISLGIRLTILFPNYDPETNTLTSTNNIGATNREYVQSTTGDNDFARISFNVYSENKSDVKLPILRGIGEFIKTSLEGTGDGNYYVKYVEGDTSPSGRSNSLYYRRYLMLNNRMNYLEGTLANLMPLLRNQKYFTAQQQYTDNLEESYNKFLSVVPVSKMEPLSWMPAQEATSTTVELPGKFYYTAELEALRGEISGQCILTCSRCKVQQSCPFYDEEEIIKMYCTPAETIDLYLKDNELDLIAYTSETTENDLMESIETTYPDVYEVDEDGNRIGESIDIDELKKKHLIYRDILSKVSEDKKESFEGRDIQEVRGELEGLRGIFDTATDGESMGYLLGARYGTVQKNPIASLANNSEKYLKESNYVKIPEYQFLYDALYIKDTESYFTYGVSSDTYDVSFEKGPRGNKKRFKGKVKLKTPLSLKAFSNANASDYVYLVSDDTKDEDGNRIVPVIYLGQLGNLQWSFNIVSDPNKGIQDANDKSTYLSDVAQWCINYYKGTCYEDIIGDIGTSAAENQKEIEVDRDQYWMPEIKKKIYSQDENNGISGYKWLTLEGRPRESSGYQEPLMSEDMANSAMIAAGKPVVANYINFLRKFSIRIYDASVSVYDEDGSYNEANAWKIPWVKGIERGETKILSDGTEISWDSQRAALAYMKTNLRLAIVKNIE